MKKLGMFIAFIICFFHLGTVKANTLNSINTTVNIDENGNGNVTEVWDMNADKGTESYHSFKNAKDRQITNFTVNMDGKAYNSLSSWNTDDSKEKKAFKNGINYTNDGLELCWGIEYGNHTYTLNYTIENLVWQYDDSQILYFSFFPQNMKQKPQAFSLTIKGNDFSNVKYSSYGFKSKNEIADGEIRFKSTGSIAPKEYVVALVGFPEDMFTLNITKSGTYEIVAKEAQGGASLNMESSHWLFPMITFGIIMISILFGLRGRNLYKYDTTNFVIPKEVNNCRDIPFDKDIISAYFIGERQGLIKRENFMGAILLKWIKEKRITMVATEGKIFDLNKNDNYYIDLKNIGTCDNLTEVELSQYLISASKDNCLKPKEFKKWCTQNYTKINKWLDDSNERSKQKLISEGFIEKKEEYYNKTKTKTVYVLTSKLQEETIRLKGLKQFLNNMTLIEDKKAIEVHIWDEYLIFAQLFGIANKVAQQFKDFHPAEYTQNEGFYDNIFWISSFSTMSVTAATAASSGGSFSGGGMSSGGFSSGGGGIR